MPPTPISRLHDFPSSYGGNSRNLGKAILGSSVHGTYLERQIGQAEELVEEPEAKTVAHWRLGVAHVAVITFWKVKWKIFPIFPGKLMRLWINQQVSKKLMKRAKGAIVCVHTGNEKGSFIFPAKPLWLRYLYCYYKNHSPERNVEMEDDILSLTEFYVH